MNGLHYSHAGEQRKQMAQIFSIIIQEKVVYKRVPTCAYQIGFFTISKDGVLSWTEDTDAETVKGVVAGLQMMGFTAKMGLCIAEKTDFSEKAAPDETPEEEIKDSAPAYPDPQSPLLCVRLFSTFPYRTPPFPLLYRKRGRLNRFFDKLMGVENYSHFCYILLKGMNVWLSVQYAESVVSS